MPKKPAQREPGATVRTLPFRHTALTALLSTALAQVQMAHAACAPAATAGNDTIVCSATVAAPLDGGDGNDTITNQGTIAADSTVTQNVPPPLDLGTGSGTSNNTVSAEVTAIQGGAGDDTISNTGAVTSSAAASLLKITAPVTITGSNAVNATNTVAAAATGIAGDAGAGSISNTGQVQANAAASLTNVNVEHNLVDTTRGNLQIKVAATATGIDGADGDGWSVTNQNQVSAVATASSNSTSIEANLADAAVGDLSLTVAAQASAISAGAGRGSITNSGNLQVQAQAHSDEISANISYLDLTVVPDPAPAQATTTVAADGAGLDGRAASGALTVSNSAAIDVQAKSVANSVGVSLASEGAPQGVKTLFEGLADETGIASIGVTAQSRAAAMLGGSAADILHNTSTVLANAEAAATQTSINVGVSLVDWKVPTPGIVLGSAGTAAFARGLGLDGGAGNDQITNDGSVTASSAAIARAATVSANISGFTDSSLGGGSIPVLGSLSASLAVADTTTRAHADAAGLRGNDGNDTITNNGGISVDAESLGTAVSAAISVNVKFKEGENLFAANAVGARAVTLAESTAIGIDGGAAQYHQDPHDDEKVVITSDDDIIANTGNIHVTAGAEVTAVAAAVTVGGTVKGNGVALNLAASDTSSLGYARAIGVDGGAGADQVTNTGTMVADAKVDALSVSSSLQVGFANKGAVVGAALARSVALSDATATGIGGGAGNDTLTNNQRIEAHANAGTKAFSVTVSLSGTGDGVSIGGSVSDTRGTANATATGIDGGADSDSVRNTSVIDVSNVNASARAAAISVELAGAENGVAAGLALANSSANANAVATGLEGGSGADQLQNSGSISLQNLSALSDAIAVSVAMNATLDAGVAAGVAMTDASTNSSVVAAGISGGDGDDAILNTGTITASNGIGSEARATSAAVTLDVSSTGAALGAALSNSSSNALTQLSGIDGGAGNDTIDNRGAITLQDVTANTNALSIGVSLTAAVDAGVAAGVTMTDASTHSSVLATGIAGGDGDDAIMNSAAITATDNIATRAMATSASVTASVSMAGAALGAAFSDASSNADTRLTGIDGGAGSESIDNRGAIALVGNSTIDTTSIGISLTAAAGVGGGMELVNADANAATTVTGIDGGTGRNDIANNAHLSVDANSSAKSLGIVVGVALDVGGDYTVAEVESHSTATAVGIGEAGSPSAAGEHGNIVNSGLLDINTAADVSGTAISVQLRGESLGSTSISSLADGYGIHSGEGATVINSAGDMNVTSNATATGFTLSANVAGKSLGDSDTTADARATGIAAGAGDDMVLNTGLMKLVANSSATATSIAATLAGTARTDAQTMALTTATGIDGGAGDDQLGNSKSLDISASSSTDATGVTVSLFGTTGSDITNTPISLARAMTGGDGNDIVMLGGQDVRISARSSANVQSSSWSIGGATAGRAGVQAEATAVGLDGGSGDDVLVQNAGTLVIDATSYTSSSSSGWTLFGTSGVETALTATARALGFDGGDGADLLHNETAFTARSHATLEAFGGAGAIFGGASTSTEVGASSTTIGMSGGAGNDRIENLAALTLSADTSINSQSVAFSFAGNVDVNELLKAHATVVGLDGGSGDNIIINTAAITGTATASAFTTGWSVAGITGGAAASGKAATEASATGIAAGSGADHIQNSGALTVNASIEPLTSSATSAGVFFGNGAVEGRIDGHLAATGIDAGDGDNSIVNSADVTVSVATTSAATANSYADGSDFSFFTDGHAVGYAQAQIEADATGIRGGNGASMVANSGAIAVHMEGVAARAYTDPNGGSTSGYGLGNVDTIANARGQGLQFGAGNSVLRNDGTIDVLVNPFATSLSDVDATGLQNANSTVTARATSEASGIAAGDGDQQIISNGAIHVTAAPVAQAKADVDGGGTFGDGYGVASNYASARAYGLQTGDGTTRIENHALLSVIAAPNARAYDGDRNVNADGHGDGDADAFVDSQSFAQSYGIKTGVGAYSILNTDAITVSANAASSAGYSVSPGGGTNGHATSTTTLYSQGYAAGIWLGGGSADIVNQGAITVTAEPSLNVAYAGGDGGPYRFLETYGVAFGIAGGLGNGNQSLVNDGTIQVRASSYVYAVNDGNSFDPTSQRQGGPPAAVGVDFQGNGYKSIVNNGTIDVAANNSLGFTGLTHADASATAVNVSGDGVTVINNGTITARDIFAGLLVFPGYAVNMASLGAGQDLILGLGRNSVTNGDVLMGGDVATLMLDGTPVLNGTITLFGNHAFNLVLDNDGSFSHVLPSVAHVTKNGAGVFTLPTLNTVQGMTLNRGTLSLQGSYTFASTGLFEAGIGGDGSNGGLLAAGTVGLDGTLRVVGDAGLYQDGTRYRLIEAADITAASAFDTIDLPDATALVSFTTERSASAFDVVAHVDSFASVGGNRTRTQVGQSLDAAARHPSDVMRDQLGVIQHLSSAQLQRTYDTLSPVAHDVASSVALANFSQYDDALWQRLFDPTMKLGGAANTASSVARPLQERDSRSSPEFGMWMRTFHRDGDQDAGAAFTGYQYRQGGFALGYDRLFGNFSAGASIGTVQNHLDADAAAGSGHVNSTLYSLYSGYNRDNYYADGVVSYGHNNYALARQIEVGASSATAASTHDGHAISTGVSGGANYDAAGWSFGPFASLQYTRLSEAAFNESGGVLALNVESRNVDSLASRLGGRLGHRIGWGAGEWMPELDLAWLHDLSSGDRAVTAAYAGSPDQAFSVDGLPVQRDGALAGASLSYRAGGFAARLSWRGEYRSGFSAHTVFGGVQYVF